jgi:hypothetical protein
MFEIDVGAKVVIDSIEVMWMDRQPVLVFLAAPADNTEVELRACALRGSS